MYIREYMNIAQSMYQNISSLWSSEGKGSFLENKKLLELGNIIQSVDKNSIMNEQIPQMVVIGTQSSGKSSVLNRILRMDLLPVGKQMVTRTPLHMELNQRDTGENAQIQFGTYRGEGNSWHVTHNLEIGINEPTVDDTNKIISIIEGETRRLAGNQKNISKTPIIMRIFSSNVPTLTLVDLPGLTSVACKDKGQPANIKEQIIELATSYIKNPRSLILGVMAARDDLETDMALELIKRHEPSGDRTIGIITKIDLMNRGSDVNHYLEGRISNDLKLKYGYFALKNRSLEERISGTALDSFKIEGEYFSKNSVYKCKDRLGLLNIEGLLVNIMIDSIRDNLPIIKRTVEEELSSTRTLLHSLGTPIGDSIQERQTLLFYAVSTFNKLYNKSLEERGAKYNIGRNIRDIFIKFRNDVKRSNPFHDKHLYTDKYIEDAIYNCEGNHMSTLSLPIDVIESCIRDDTKKPLFTVLDRCNNLCDKIVEQLVKLIDMICEEKSLSRFPLVVTTIRDRLRAILGDLTEETRGEIYKFIQIENNYIWTDREEFVNLFQSVLQRNRFKMDVSGIRQILSAYYETYVDTVQISVPKMVMFHLVSRSENMIGENLLYDITKNVDLKRLISEPGEISAERVALTDKLDYLRRGIQILDNIN